MKATQHLPWQTLGLALLATGAAAQQAEPKWAPQIAVEAKPGSKRGLGELDLLLPLHQNSTTLVFGNVRARFDDQNSHEGNFGLGVRQMQANGWNLGAYSYFDRRRSPNEHYYSQATLGLEALGPNFDFRANTYLPTGTKVRELSELSSASVSGGSVQVSTDIREERALRGFDMEAGWRMPFFDSGDNQQLRVYAGGYRFTDGLLTVKGPRLRAEYVFEEVPLLGQGARIFLGFESQHDDARGTQGFVSMRIHVPFGARAQQGRALTVQERRMTAPIVRDVDIVTQARVTSTLSETATTASGQNITVLDSATTAGFNLHNAVNAVGDNSTVILSGTFDNVGSTVRLRTGQTLMGAGTLNVRTSSGRTATLTTQTATISSGPHLAIEMGNNSTLRGMTVNSVNSVYNIDTYNKSNVSIIDNTITNTVTANDGTTRRALNLENGSGHLVSGNTVTIQTAASSTTTPVVALDMLNASGTIRNNHFSASGGGSAYYVQRDSASAMPGSTGNTVGSGTCNVSGSGTGSIAFTNAPDCN